MLKQSLQQKLLQKLSPQQIQFIKLLQVPTVSLDARIKEELEENPALEDMSLTNMNEPAEEYPDKDPEDNYNNDEQGSEGDEFNVDDYLQDEDVNLKNLSELVIPGTAIKYGNFLSQLISFIVVAFALFLIIKGINSMKKKEEEVPAAAPAPTKEEVLLTEIRDLLKTKN